MFVGINTWMPLFQLKKGNALREGKVEYKEAKNQPADLRSLPFLFDKKIKIIAKPGY
jgi:hypothetical protein